MELYEVAINVLMGKQEQCTYAELDSRFFQELDTLHPQLTSTEEELVIGAWIALTDHVLEDRRPLTDAERLAMINLFRRIAFKHGYFQIVE